MIFCTNFSFSSWVPARSTKSELNTRSQICPMTGHFLMLAFGVKEGNLRKVTMPMSIQD